MFTSLSEGIHFYRCHATSLLAVMTTFIASPADSVVSAVLAAVIMPAVLAVLIIFLTVV